MNQKQNAATSGALPERSFRTALAAIAGAQKKAPGVLPYTKWINRPLARYAAAFGYTLGLTPTHITLLSAFCTVLGVGSLVFMAPSVRQSLLTATLLAMGYILDSADGQLARLSKTSSPAGDWLDHTVDTFAKLTLHSGVLIAFWRYSSLTPLQIIVPLLFLIASQTGFFAVSLADKILPKTSSKDTWQSPVRSLLLFPLDSGILSWSFVLWAWTPVFLGVYTVLCGVNAAYSLGSLIRNYRRLRAMQA